MIHSSLRIAKTSNTAKLIFGPSLALAAMMSFAGFAGAQGTLTTNALGLWRSDSGLSNQITPTMGVAQGATGNHYFQILPPDVLTYYKSQTSGGARTLDFRGVGILVTVPTAGGGKSHLVPRMDIRRAIPAPTPNEGRLLPDMSTAGLYVVFGEFNLGVQPANTTFYVNYTLPTSVTFPVGAPTSVGVPATNALGEGICWRAINVQSQHGTAGGSLLHRLTTNESAFGANGPLSGITFAAAPPNPAATVWMDQVTVGGNPTLNHEWCVTFFFDQSMIAPIKNAFKLPNGGTIAGGTPLPTSLYPSNGGFAITCDDGRGALSPKPGDVISYSINSNQTTKLGPTGAGNVWLVPFVLFDGDVVPTDPLPEDWIGSGGVPQLSHIYPMPLQNYLDDLAAVLGVGGPGFGAQLNPNNSTLALWLGTDQLNGYFNPTALVNGLGLTSISTGPAFGGPETKMYDSVTNPTGVMGRNLYQFGTRTGELKTLSVPQTGYTPVVQSSNPLYIGMEYPILNPNTLGGRSFYVTCWILDLASPTNPFVLNIIDMTSVLKFSFQN
ncbi:MAG: hypothetical protein ACKVS6_06800 [Planctomycetota bacterium]